MPFDLFPFPHRRFDEKFKPPSGRLDVRERRRILNRILVVCAAISGGLLVWFWLGSR
jgi:hypothetical protein